MTRRIPRAAALLLGGLLLASSSDAADLGEVATCLRANLPRISTVVRLELRSVDRSGGSRTVAGEMHWKRGDRGLSKILIELETPPDVRGSAYLVRERETGQDMWVYLPDLGKVRRIHPRTISGQLFGTDFSYEDVTRLQRITTEQNTERLPDGTLGARAVYRVRTVPNPDEESAYSRIEYFLDRETCMPLRMELFDPAGELRKVVTGDPATLERAGAGWILAAIRIQDLRSGTESHLHLSEVRVDADLPDGMFETSHLARRD